MVRILTYILTYILLLSRSTWIHTVN